MGWNCTITVVDGVQVGDLARLGWRVTDTSISWDEASTSAHEGIAAMAQDDKLVLTSGGLELLDETDRLASLGPVCVGLFSSVSDTYEWRMVAPGVRRAWAWSGHEPVLDEGEPHELETGLDGLDEDNLALLLERVAGLRFDERLQEASAVVVEPGGAVPEPAPRRGLLKRWFG